MLCYRWRYECGACGVEYFLPGADLSFFYGTFLGVSKNAEAAVFDTSEDPIFDQIEQLVESQLGPVERGDFGEIIRQIVTVVSGPDSCGDPFVLDGSPGCPACGSTKRAHWSETSDPWPVEPGMLTHHAWDSWTADERAQAVHQHLVVIGLVQGPMNA